MSVAIDANVIVSALRETDVNHADSRRFLDEIATSTLEVFLPSLVLPECCGAVARASGDAALGDAAADEVDRLLNAEFVPLTEHRARSAARLASRHMLRGADAVYVSVADEFKATLVTWDNEMLIRARPIVSTMIPTDWLSAKNTKRTL